jgi:hypothetical protein
MQCASICNGWCPRGSKYSNNRCMINIHDTSHACLPKVATHPIAPALIRNLIKFPMDMAIRIVDTQPSTSPILLALRPSPHDGAFCTLHTCSKMQMLFNGFTNCLAIRQCSIILLLCIHYSLIHLLL